MKYILPVILLYASLGFSPAIAQAAPPPGSLLEASNAARAGRLVAIGTQKASHVASWQARLLAKKHHGAKH